MILMLDTHHAKEDEDGKIGDQREGRHGACNNSLLQNRKHLCLSLLNSALISRSTFLYLSQRFE